MIFNIISLKHIFDVSEKTVSVLVILMVAV